MENLTNSLEIPNADKMTVILHDFLHDAFLREVRKFAFIWVLQRLRWRHFLGGCVYVLYIFIHEHFLAFCSPDLETCVEWTFNQWGFLCHLGMPTNSLTLTAINTLIYWDQCPSIYLTLFYIHIILENAASSNALKKHLICMFLEGKICLSALNFIMLFLLVCLLFLSAASKPVGLFCLKLVYVSCTFKFII